MQLLTNNSAHKNPYGDFELQPDQGWIISQTYLDYESGLLVINARDERPENWKDTGLGSQTIPSKYYLVDIANKKILSFEEWSRYFSYKPIESWSENGQYHCTIKRTHLHHQGLDIIQEEVVDVQQDSVVYTSKSIAFNEYRRETFLEQKEQEYKAKARRLAKIEALPTLEEYHIQALKALKPSTVLLYYWEQESLFQLFFQQQELLLRKATNWSTNKPINELTFQTVQTFEEVEQFSATFLRNKQWYLHHKPFYQWKDQMQFAILKKPLIDFFNELRQQHAFTFEEYKQLQEWDHFIYQKRTLKPNTYQQYCPTCKQSVPYRPRYPKSICASCSALPIIDEEGLRLSFYNTGLSGGLKIVYQQEGVTLKEETNQLEKLCFLEGTPLLAQEAKFGGIVIQTKT
ncbi:MAG: hypothetical protein ACRBFS_18250 [Aureispira sp.]